MKAHRWKPGDICRLSFSPGNAGRWLVLVASTEQHGPPCQGLYLSGRSSVRANLGHGPDNAEWVPEDEVPDHVWTKLAILRLTGGCYDGD